MPRPLRRPMDTERPAKTIAAMPAPRLRIQKI
jgi:hypothetical protein